MIFLDPHYVQEAVRDEKDLQNEVVRGTYQSQRAAKKIKLEALDPCIGLGFLISSSHDLQEIEQAFSQGGALANLASFVDKQIVLPAMLPGEDDLDYSQTEDISNLSES